MVLIFIFKFLVLANRQVKALQLHQNCDQSSKVCVAVELYVCMLEAKR